VSASIAMLLAGQFFFGDQTDRTMRETRKRVREYADCIVKKRPQDAAAAVLSISENTTLVKDYPRLLDYYCLTGFTETMAFPGDLLRYALADALVRRELANQPPIDPASIARLAHFLPRPPASVVKVNGEDTEKKPFDRQQWQFGVRLAFSQASQFGECVVRGDPLGSQRLLKSTPTSQPEAATMNALQPVFSACLDKGSKLYLTKEVLRGTIALNYYRLSKAPRVAGVVK
jgi:hypothetical protein